jgi:hypothetical protein
MPKKTSAQTFSATGLVHRAGKSLEKTPGCPVGVEKKKIGISFAFF